MPLKWKPNYVVTDKVVSYLLRIESAKEKVLHLPLTPTVLHSLRESARLYTTHYSTMIEGNVLSPDQIETVLKHEGHFPGRERDEREVKGYYAALKRVEQAVSKGEAVTEGLIQTLHALVMSGGKEKITPTPYRDGQNVIRDGQTRAIVYLPPESKDVPSLMRELCAWIQDAKTTAVPLVGALAHYQFATIHPYFDGNGRTARLLTTLLLHLGGYDLKGLYSLEEYYARHLGAYYEAISVNSPYNYYMGRADIDITPWVEYFLQGMALSFENVLRRMAESSEVDTVDQSQLLMSLDPRQRKVLELFRELKTITSRDVGGLFGFKPRTSSQICTKWVESGFLEVVDSSKKGRKYRLASRFLSLVDRGR